MKKAAPHNKQNGTARAHFTSFAAITARLPWDCRPQFVLLALLVAGGLQ